MLDSCPRLRVVLAALVATLGLALSVAAMTARPASADPLPGAAAATGTPAVTGSRFQPRTTLRPTPLAATTEVANSGRGQYAWLGYDPQPASWPVRDVYYRDQVYWGRIETGPGVYDWSWFEDGLARAAATKGRFGFRVMAYCPGCWMENPALGKPPAYPGWLPRQGATSIPDWNSEQFLGAWEGLVRTIANRYADDPRLGYVDIGGYGAYGEWHVSEGTEITDASAARMIRAVVDAFPRQQVVINAVPRHTETAMGLSPRVGLRVDCLGAPWGFYWLEHGSAAMRARWRTAPVLTEWCHSGDTTMSTALAQVGAFHVSTTSSGNLLVPYASMTAADQAAYRRVVVASGYRYAVTGLGLPARLVPGSTPTIRTTIANTGSAPTYDAWGVTLRLRRADGSIAASWPLGIDLRGHLPGTTAYVRSVTVPATLPAGSYTAQVVVADPSGYLPPMGLALAGRGTDGSYPLGTVRVGPLRVASTSGGLR